MNWKCLPIFSENKLYRQVDEYEYDENITTTCIAINKLDNGCPPLKPNSLEEYYHWLNSENSGPIFSETLPQFKDCRDIFIAAYGAKDVNTVEYVKTNNGGIKKGFKYLIGIKVQSVNSTEFWILYNGNTTLQALRDLGETVAVVEVKQAITDSEIPSSSRP